MPIRKDEIIDLMKRFHDVVMYEKGSAAAQAAFFLHPEPRIFILHGEDITLQQNYEIHRKLTDERHIPAEQWEITPLCDKPERARAVGAVYWEGRPVDPGDGGLVKCLVGEDWVVQRNEAGDLKIALYINSYHHFLPDSAPLTLT
jgi:hypothetical protein